MWTLQQMNARIANAQSSCRYQENKYNVEKLVKIHNLLRYACTAVNFKIIVEQQIHGITTTILGIKTVVLVHYNE